MSRYDIIVILEVVDVSGAAVKVFLEELNRWVYVSYVLMKQILLMFPLLSTVLCLTESTQPITTLCSSVSDWEGTDTRSSFCFSTGKDIIIIACGKYYHQTVALKTIFVPLEGTMWSIWLTAINMKTTRWTTWMFSQENRIFCTSNRTILVSLCFLWCRKLSDTHIKE